MSVIVTAVLHPRQGSFQDLVDALRASIPAVHDEDGCQLYAIHDNAGTAITMIEKWDSAELLEVHANGSAVAALEAAVFPFIASPTTVTTMTPIPAGSENKGIL